MGGPNVYAAWFGIKQFYSNKGATYYFFYDVDLEINKQKMISDIGKVNSFQRVLT